MPQVSDSKKVFQFRIECDGIDNFEVQELKLPDIEIDVVTHGEGNTEVKTAGKVKTGKIELKKLRRTPFADPSIVIWMSLAQNAATGAGTPAAFYKRDLIIRELSQDGITSLNHWLIEGAWPSKISRENFNRMSSDNFMESITLECDKIIQIL